MPIASIGLDAECEIVNRNFFAMVSPLAGFAKNLASTERSVAQIAEAPFRFSRSASRRGDAAI
jgi:hypothetical protein